MNAKLKKRLEAVRVAIHNNVEDLPPKEYKEVLEELTTDIEGRLEALAEEQDEERDR